MSIEMHKDLLDPVTYDPLVDAVTLHPCGHVVNETTALSILEQNGLCPLDRIPIESFVANHSIRNVVVDTLEETPTEKAFALFEEGKELSSQQKYAEATKIFLRVLELSPKFEKARNFLEFCMNIASPPPTEEALVHAVREGDISAIEAILKAGVSPNTREAEDSPLHLAASKNATEILEILLRYGADPKAKNARNEKPLEVAVLHGHSKSAQLLLAAKRKDQQMQRVPRGILESAFGAHDWNIYFGDVGIEPPLPPDIEEILQSPCPFWPDEMVKDTHFLVLIPKAVNGRSLNLNSFKELMRHPKQPPPKIDGNYFLPDDETQSKINMKYDTEKIWEHYGEREVENSYWVLMTKYQLPNSREACIFGFEKKHVKKYQNYHLPFAIEAAITILMHWFKTGEEIYYSLPDVDGYTVGDLVVCQEQIEEKSVECFGEIIRGRNWPICVGGLGKKGLFVGDGLILQSADYHVGDSSSVGIAALRKFT